jgi:hypothetical protein
LTGGITGPPTTPLTLLPGRYIASGDLRPAHEAPLATDDTSRTRGASNYPAVFGRPSGMAQPAPPDWPHCADRATSEPRHPHPTIYWI